MMRLAVVGVGSVRRGPALVASLANFYGERPLEIRLFDADQERLDLFSRFARTCFDSTQTTHEVIEACEVEEALEGVQLVLVAVGRNCARKLSKGASGDVGESIPKLLASMPGEARVLSLLGESLPLPIERYESIDWPEDLDEEARRATPHQILRWIRKEEYVHEFLEAHAQSPVKEWLNEAMILF